MSDKVIEGWHKDFVFEQVEIYVPRVEWSICLLGEGGRMNTVGVDCRSPKEVGAVRK